MFDFEGDGKAEVIYGDECFLWVFDGTTGAVRFAAPHTSFTGTEASLVADVPGAEAAYRRADERGHAAAASNLGVLLEEHGDLSGAEAAYRRADERGDPHGAFNRAVLLEERGDLPGAEAAYRRADAGGDAEVGQTARAILLELGFGVSQMKVDSRGLMP